MHTDRQHVRPAATIDGVLETAPVWGKAPVLKIDISRSLASSRAEVDSTSLPAPTSAHTCPLSRFEEYRE
jgi:hypothetical protein